MKRPARPRFNQAQLKATSDLLLEVSKALALATIIGLVLPEIGGRIGLPGAIWGGVLSLVAYIIGILLLKGVKQ